MNKTAIKNFAVWARNKLIADITYKAGLIGVSEKGIAQPLPQSSKDLQFFDIGTKDYAQVAGSDIEQRNALVRAIQEKECTCDYKTAFKAVIEEVAYTWFNRLIAIRFMEVNEYLPSRIRVLSSENPAKNEPDFVTTPFDTDMEFTMAEQDKIMQLKDENKLDELFRMLFIKQCNKLHEILPELFEETNNYTELLLSISFTDNDGIVYHLVHDIPEDDFNVEKEGQVEIIGWMYQYYNIEPKDETFALLKKNVKITKERIPAATQLFTPDWIVRYMVENSLGRLWVEGHPSDSLKENWKYYLEEAEQETSVQAQLEQIRVEYRNLNPEDIKVIDPCMGSGHILVYCFDVLMQIYESQGYTQRDAAQSILENNLFGLDIDKRAAQLAYFAIMMKARQYDRRIFAREIKPHVYAIEESNGINRGQLKYFGAALSPIERNKAKLQIIGLLDTMIDAKEYGSILNVENYDWELLQRFAESIDDAGQMSLDTIGIDQTQAQLLALINIAHVMAQKYDVVVTNPPYMGGRSYSSKLSNKVQELYPDGKQDLFAVFIQRCTDFANINRFVAMITMHSFMFLASFERMRYDFLNNNLISLIHLGIKAFDEIGNDVVQTASYVFRKQSMNTYQTTFCRLVDSKDQQLKKDDFLAKKYLSTNSVADFLRIPGATLAYWVPEAFIENYEKYPALGEMIEMSSLNKTGDNETYLRFWWEVAHSKIGNRWVFYSKGGNFRRYYGNIDVVIDWSESARWFYKNNKTSNLVSEEYWYKEGITYSAVTSRGTGFRYLPTGCVYDMGGPAIFVNNGDRLISILALLNSSVASYYFNVMNPSINLQTKDIKQLPVILDSSGQIESLASTNMMLAKKDWNCAETSYDFTAIAIEKALLSKVYENRIALATSESKQFMDNLAQINERYAEIYHISNHNLPQLEERDNAIEVPNIHEWATSIASYAVGCMFGRYSLDEPGLVYAGGEWDSSKYSTFIPDKDNCIPITDEAYFEDDLVGQFVGWMKKAFGEENLEANLDFIAKALGNKGATSCEVIRNYFLNDFMKDHIKIYQKRPIYWLFDSGKQNGFKALVYMHRWNADTVGNLRVEYLHKMQHTYEREIVRMQETIDNSRDSREVSKATKRKDKLQKQLKETKDYDAMLAHIALSRIEIDLDDGVKVNYEKVQTGRDGKKMQILAKI